MLLHLVAEFDLQRDVVPWLAARGWAAVLGNALPREGRGPAPSSGPHRLRTRGLGIIAAAECSPLEPGRGAAAAPFILPPASLQSSELCRHLGRVCAGGRTAGGRRKLRLGSAMSSKSCPHPRALLHVSCTPQPLSAAASHAFGFPHPPKTSSIAPSYTTPLSVRKENPKTLLCGK